MELYQMAPKAFPGVSTVFVEVADPDDGLCLNHIQESD
jgi:hypothetical protein